MTEHTGSVRPMALVVILATFAISSCAPVNAPGPPATVAPSPVPSVGAPRNGWDLVPENVGLRTKGLACEQLAPYTGPTIVAAGTTIIEQRITTPLNLSAGSITIERSCIQPTTVDRGMPVIATTNYNTMKPAAGEVVVRDSDFDGSLLQTRDSAMVAAFVGIGNLTNNYIHHFGSGIALMDTGDKYDALVEHNLVTNLVAWGDGATEGNHSDAFTIRDFDASRHRERKAVVRNNRFDCNSGNDTGALFIQTYSGRIDNVTVEGNLLESGGYQLGLNQANNAYRNMHSLNNRFTGTGYGPAYVQGGSGWDSWEDNYIFDPNQESGRGAVVPKP